MDSNHLKRRQVAMCLLITQLLEDDECSSKRGKTRQWIKRREEKGFYNCILRELSIEDSVSFKEMLRMSHECLLQILGAIEKDITPCQVSGGNTVISPKARLVITLRFLATAETFRSMSFQFRVSRAAISYIVKDVCQAIIKNMRPLFLALPSSAEDWVNIAHAFEEKWQFPNCVGAIDGKHIVMQPPPGAGSRYYNYKGTHSIVLLAIAGPDYECIYADVGTNGRISDGGVWNKCSLAKAIEDKKIDFPVPKYLPHGAKRYHMCLLEMMRLPLKVI
ncbi:uncharacterized protein LOC135693217 [Rhopilema esculentum]|uniref:uncharacterized protein LOC135693217 n=1 Tax=Rhopilema esculentum TaxID=499914 RepID=UPI0031D052E4